jgi:hypothetical protein
VKRDGGRPPKERTGRRGRPCKAKTTKKAFEVAMSKKRGRILQNHKGKRRDWDVEDAPMEVDIMSFDNTYVLFNIRFKKYFTPYSFGQHAP